MKTTLPCILAAAALLVSGCDRPAATSGSPNGTIAFLDLDAAAKRLGRDIAITDELKAENDALVKKLTDARDDLQAQFNKTKTSVGDKPTQEDSEKLSQLEQSLNAELQNRLQNAREELNKKEVAMIQQFREEVKPIAQKVAAKKGFNTVMLRSDIVVISVDPATDITDDVVAEMISSGKGAATATPTATP